jgi:hypothetical protein
MVSWFVAVAVALGAALAALLVTAARARRRARRFADAVHVDIEPYLRRKSAEVGLLHSPPVWTRRTPPDDIVAWSCLLARRLNDRERGGSPAPDSFELGATRPIP